MVKVFTKLGIKLPYVGKDKFIELMRIGLKYDREEKMFFIENMNYATQIKAILEELLNDKVVFGQECIICKQNFSCSECEFIDICKSSDIPSYCICSKCLSEEKIYPIYLEKVELMLKRLEDG